MADSHVCDINTEKMLDRYGIDYIDAMQRMMGAHEFYHRLTLRYLDDPNYDKLIECMKHGEHEEAYFYAHTLKGLSGNLSLVRVFELSSKICAALKAGEIAEAHSYIPALSAANDKARQGIMRLPE